MLVVGLVLHNALMAQLWDLGVRGTTLDVVAAWKEALLLVALLLVAWHVRRFPAVRAADILALAYAVGPFAMLVKGKVVAMPAGSPLSARIAEIPSSSPPVVGGANPATLE